MALLFTPLQLRGLRMRNRAWISPMCQYSSQDGRPNDWHLVHLGSFAKGGAGLVMMEATAVVPEGRITPGCGGLWTDGQAADYERITAFLHAQGAVAGIQLAHAGRKGSSQIPWLGRGTVPPDQGGWQTVGPSATPFDGFAAPVAMTQDQIDAVVAAWVAAAQRARGAGFDVVEVHAAHGYLLHQFLSPLSNLRTDEYGGDLSNRARLLLRVAEAVREVWPDDRPVFVRVSATDWIPGGWDPEQTVEVARWLADLGIDLIDTSSGGLSTEQQIPVGPGYQVPLAARIRAEAGVATSAVGLILNGHQAEDVLASGAADAIMLGRPALRDPAWAQHAATELGVEPPWPTQYHRVVELPD
jgi:2,4-dienoyl-CoA reductase-like NADH-dependent reductase (Old Yellow Enzyme family)